ncbi:MAG: AAA family ATPase [Cyclobacteriaceae bacterium]
MKSLPLKVIITGPESSGKTTLARQLATVFAEPWVPEFARDYINTLDRKYQETDLLEIARGQIKREEEYTKEANQLLICDTGLEVLKIWSEYRFGRCHPWILEQLEKKRPELYLLCAPDIPWEYDPQRENPDDRQELFEIYRKELSGQNVQEVSGSRQQRLATAQEAAQQFLKP